MPHHWAMAEGKVRRTPEAEHLAEQERLFSELTEQLATRETEFATLGSEFARFRATDAGIEEVGGFCRTYCPVRLACVEEDCQLFRLEKRCDDALGIQRNPATS